MPSKPRKTLKEILGVSEAIAPNKHTSRKLPYTHKDGTSRIRILPPEQYGNVWGPVD